MSHDREQWNTIVEAAEGSFLQSWEWGELQRELGVPFWRLSGEKWQALVIKQSLPLGQNWLYLPRAPIGAADATFTDQVGTLAKEQRSLFIHVEPPLNETFKVVAPWQKSDRNVQPQHSNVLDLTRSEEELLAAMHQKTRYNIRLAEKKGVTVRFSKSENDLQHFFRLSRDVAKRGAFRFHPEAYYQAQLKVLGEANMMEIAVAEHEGEPLAVHLLYSFAGTTTYAHGASASQKRDLMAPHLLQWGSIKHAKDRGNQRYDFYGVAPAGEKNHPWAGITRFKEGFGGTRIMYATAQELVSNRFNYTFCQAARKLLTK